jgi:hypothetical protein
LVNLYGMSMFAVCQELALVSGYICILSFK